MWTLPPLMPTFTLPPSFPHLVLHSLRLLSYHLSTSIICSPSIRASSISMGMQNSKLLAIRDNSHKLHPVVGKECGIYLVTCNSYVTFTLLYVLSLSCLYWYCFRPRYLSCLPQGPHTSVIIYNPLPLQVVWLLSSFKCVRYDCVIVSLFCCWLSLRNWRAYYTFSAVLLLLDNFFRWVLQFILWQLLTSTSSLAVISSLVTPSLLLHAGINVRLNLRCPLCQSYESSFCIR